MLPQLQAERQLLAIEAGSMGNPYLDPRHRAKVIERHLNRARGDTVRAKSAHEALMAAGIQVVHVPTPKRARAATGRAGTRRKAARG